MSTTALTARPAFLAPDGQPITTLTAAQAPSLALGGSSATRVLHSFSPEFAATVAAAAAAAAPRLADAVGVLLDARPNFHGAGSWAPRQTWTLLEMALEAPAASPARQAAVRFLQKRYPTYEWFAGAWEIDIAGSWQTLTGIELQTGYNVETQAARARFTEVVAERYMATLASAVRAAAPGKLILGLGLAGDAPTGAITACAKFGDAVTLVDASHADIDHAATLVSKPILVPDGSGWRVATGAVGPATALDTALQFVPGSLGEKPALLDLLGEGAAAPSIQRADDTRAVFSRERDRHSLVFDSGTGDGFAIVFATPASATGYNALLIDAEMRAGLEFKIALATAAGTFTSHVQVGRAGGRHRYIVPFQKLIAEESGAALDLATLRTVSLLVRGGQANGTIKFYGVKLYKQSA